TQFFGGVPGETVFSSYAIAACSALIVAAIAITLSVTRTAGRRAVFIFYISVVMYLFVTYFFDIQLRTPVAPGSSAVNTTVMTPLNPFLALEVLLRSNTYVPNSFVGETVGWSKRAWFGHPISVFCWGCALISVSLMLFSTLRLRVIGAKVGTVPWYRKVLGLGARGATERPPRSVGNNPIVWREAHSRGKTLPAILGRWSFVVVGVAIALVMLILYHRSVMTTMTLRDALATVLSAEVVIITLIALNMSATSVSREREDGSLDIILTTPIQPGPYLWGKLRGLIQFLVPMLLVPIITTSIFAIYILFNGFGRTGGITIAPTMSNVSSVGPLPFMVPELAIAITFVLPSFIAACVIVGLDQSIKSKGTIKSVIAAAGWVIVIAGALSICLFPLAPNLGPISPIAVNLLPINLVFSAVRPEEFLGTAVEHESYRVTLIVGAVVTSALYLLFVYAYLGSIKRTFMMNVRKLAGTN
ncbi:MAG: ABC transporter permease subunit, partial [Phycisphaerales bacterium]|nr:ABC transporter permease subunit [Phycisphaerales bacterium]